MAIVAYSGDPNGRVFRKTIFDSWDQARITLWNESGYFDLHDTNDHETYWDRVWERRQDPQQIKLF